MNARRALGLVFDAVADQILEELHEMRSVTENGGESIAGDRGSGVLDGDPAIFMRRLENTINVDRRNSFMAVAGQLSIGQQVRQQFVHALRSVADELVAASPSSWPR